MLGAFHGEQLVGVDAGEKDGGVWRDVAFDHLARLVDVIAGAAVATRLPGVSEEDGVAGQTQKRLAVPGQRRDAQQQRNPTSNFQLSKPHSVKPPEPNFEFQISSFQPHSTPISRSVRTSGLAGSGRTRRWRIGERWMNVLDNWSTRLVPCSPVPPK